MGDGFSGAIELVGLVVLGYVFGHFLDGRLHTAPWIAVALLTVGFAGGFLRLYYHSKMQEDEGVPKRGSGRASGVG
jgi:F0F1-type ATP synthase assembly protein I